MVRTDFDDPIKPDGTLGSDVRIRASLPTIEYLQSHGAKQIILASKLGRPVVRARDRVETIIQGNARLTMEPVARHTRSLLGKTTETLTTHQIEDFPLPAYVIDRGLYLLENLRFDWRETSNDPDFARDLASLGDLYVFDAFAMAHRQEASTVGIITHTETVVGLRVQAELEALEKLKTTIIHPFVIVLGGAKTETKIPVIDRLMDHADLICLGGVIANTFAKAQGMDIQRSVVDDGQLERANQLYKRDPNLFLMPTDYVWAGGKIMDVGEQSRRAIADAIRTAKTVFWNGTLGVTSTTAQEYKFGSVEIARAMMANRGATTIVSGGDTVGLLQEQQIDLAAFTFVSTGGGATLKYLAGEKLPALEALGA